MPVDVNTTIPLPADTDNYDLVVDLTAMRGGILQSLTDIIAEFNQRPETGTAANFLSVTCSGSGVFGGTVQVNTSDTGGPLLLTNSAATFGLQKASVAQFKFNSGRWYSDVPIRIADGAAADDAASRGYVGAREAAIGTTVAAVQTNVDALEAKSVIRYNGNQLWAPNANYANTAGYAATAGSAAAFPHNHDGTYAPAANRPAIYTGVTGNYSMGGRSETNFNLALPISGVYPGFLGLTVIDVNGDEVFASIRSGWGTPHSAPIRLKNVGSGGETVRVQWAAIY
jgi:hypothetical protein